MDPWTLTATEPSSGRVYLANGYMGTSLDFSGGTMFESIAAPCYVRGVYNQSGPDGIDRFAQIPCWNLLRYSLPAVVREYRRDLDLRRGVMKTRLLLEEQRGRLEIIHTLLVARSDPHAAVIHLDVQAEFDGELAFLAGLETPLNEDLETLELGSDDASVWLLARTRAYGIDIAEALHFEGKGWEHDDSTGQNNIHRLFRTVARSGQQRTLTQMVRLVTSLESPDPLPLTRQDHTSYQSLRQSHEDAWARLWTTDIEIEGDPEVQQYVRTALFYLWSNVREADRWSIAPMGLSSNGYNGHIFWDAEMWMYPSLLVTQPDIARSCTAYREAGLPPARMRAASNGHRGAQFPWEGAFTGEEMTPAWADTRDFQLHITADVAIGQWWYYLNTGDLAWLRDHGYPVIRECAEYWISRVEYNESEDRYEISDVVCADEYAAHVNNNAFTNAAVRKALQITERAAELLDEPVDPHWREVAGKILVPYSSELACHLEYDGFDGQVTKQADVELLAYPLEHTTDAAQIGRDLDYYARVIDPHGPAMSFCVYSIISAQLGRAQDAYEYFKKSFVPNTRPPFHIFSETPTNNEFLFCTGVGGSLQAPLFGFSGVRLRENYFVLHPTLPEQWTRLCLRGVYLVGCRTDIEIERGLLLVRRRLPGGALVTRIKSSADDLQVAVHWEKQEGANIIIELSFEAGNATSAQLVDEDVWHTLKGTAGKDVRLRIAPSGQEPALDVELPARM